MKPGTSRITIETLASGQPRPYADSRRHVRVTFETVAYGAADGAFTPSKYQGHNDDKSVREILPHISCGFTNKVRAEVEWWADRLDYLKMVSPGVWEFHVTSPYTD